METDNVANLDFKLRIVGQFEALDAMWLHVVPLPDAMHDRSGHTQLRGERAHTPVCAAVARTGLQRSVEDALLQFRRQHPWRPFATANPCNGGHAVLHE